MDRPSTSQRKADRRNELFQRLERGGGAVLAYKQTGSNAGSRLFVLQHVGREASAEIVGHIWPEGVVVGEKQVPEEELRGLGWRYDERAAGWERRWNLRSDLDRTDLRRTVDATLALLADLHDDDAGAYALVYRPPGEEDAGFAQVGCLLAVASAIVGDVLGVIMTVVRNEPIPLIEMSIFAALVGLLVGFGVFGTVFPRLLALSRRSRGRAAEIDMGLMLVVPGVLVLSTWLLVPRFGPVDGDQLLLLSGGLLVAALLGSVIPMVVVLVRRPRR